MATFGKGDVGQNYLEVLHLIEVYGELWVSEEADKFASLAEIQPHPEAPQAVSGVSRSGAGVTLGANAARVPFTHDYPLRESGSARASGGTGREEGSGNGGNSIRLNYDAPVRVSAF